MNQGRLRVLLLLLCDALVLGLSAVIALCVNGWITGETPHYSYLITRWGFAALYLTMNVFVRLYHGNPLYPGSSLAPVEEFRRLTLTTLGTGILFFAYLAFYGKTTLVSQTEVILWVALNILLAQPGRDFFRRILKCLNVAQIPVVLVGMSRDTTRLENILASSSHFGFRVVGVFPKARAARDWASANNVKHCISCEPLRVFRFSIREMLGWFSVLISLPEPGVFPIAMTRPVEFGGYGGIEMANQLRQKGTVAAKRLVEWVLAVFAVVVLLLPGALIALSLMVVYRSTHIFYRTERLGKKKVPFMIWKFRTMVPDADACLNSVLDANPKLREEWETTGKLKEDPRITPIGKLLRKTSLDEVPQLFNVLRGDMALIGPRPIVQREVQYYGKHYATVTAVKPGITGLWQVSGRSGVDYDSRVALDLYYTQNWNLWMDCWILLKTVAVVLLQRGAC